MIKDLRADQALRELKKIDPKEYDREYVLLCIARAEHILQEGAVPETYNDVLQRHEREREACIERERKENMTVTLQVNDLGGPEDKPFIIEVVFPNNLTSKMKTKVCTSLHEKLGEKWLRELGYNFKWLAAKASQEYDQKRIEEEAKEWKG